MCKRKRTPNGEEGKCIVLSEVDTELLGKEILVLRFYNVGGGNLSRVMRMKEIGHKLNFQ